MHRNVLNTSALVGTTRTSCCASSVSSAIHELHVSIARNCEDIVKKL